MMKYAVEFIPTDIFNLKRLTDLHLFVYDINEVKFNSNKTLDSLRVIYLYGFQEVYKFKSLKYLRNITDLRNIKKTYGSDFYYN